MKNIKNWVFVLGMLFFIGCGGHDQEPPVCLSEDLTNYHLVVYRGSTSNFVSYVTSLGGSVARVHESIGVAKVNGLSSRAVSRLRRNRRLITAISYDVEIDWLRQREEEVIETGSSNSTRLMDHNDPTDAAYYNFFQWNMQNIGCSDAWPIQQGDENVRVAIVDTGISPDHKDLTGRYDLTTSANFTSSNTMDLEDENGHGTEVSSIISTNNIFLAGLAPHTTMIGIKVLGTDGSGNFSDMIAGIIHAVEEADADIINVSFGSHFSTNYYLCEDLRVGLFALEKAIKYAQQQGVLVVGAAGDGDDLFDGMDLGAQSALLHLPSGFRSVMSVGAVAPINQSNFDSLTSYSNFGDSKIDVVAPGGNDLMLEGSVLDKLRVAISPSLVGGFINRYNRASGTGLATAHVSALAALISAQHNESLTPAQIKQKLIDTCDDIGEVGPDNLYGHGRINAFRAVTE